jgi:hypothetical protein
LVKLATSCSNHLSMIVSKSWGKSPHMSLLGDTLYTNYNKTITFSYF